MVAWSARARALACPCTGSMTSLKRIGWVAVLCWLALPARAQTCHSPSLREPSESGFRLGMLQLFAVFSDVEQGSYQGLITTLGWNHPWLRAEVALPLYRLAQDGGEELGPGDVAADVRVSVLRSQAFSFGPELAFSLPTGDADASLGMGHVMAMPGMWARLEVGDFGLLAQLAYGAAFGDSASTHTHHEHHAAASGAFPRVNPMNGSEFEHALGLSYALHSAVSLTARWVGAVPLEAAGVARQIVAPGLQLTADPLDASLELQFPVAGDPFDVRVSVAFGSRI